MNIDEQISKAKEEIDRLKLQKELWPNDRGIDANLRSLRAQLIGLAGTKLALSQLDKSRSDADETAENAE